MLILSRKIGQVITIGEGAEITVTILGSKGGQVKVGIGAPKEIPVHRLEIYEQIHGENSLIKKKIKKKDDNEE